MDQNGIPVMRKVVFGGLSSDTCHQNPDPCGQVTPRATALILTFLLNNDVFGRERARVWEKEVFLTLAQAFQSQLGLTIDILSERSVQDALTIETRDNGFIVVLSYILMFIYVAVALGSPRDPVKSRFGLGLSGILIVLSSMGIAFGTS
jgi:hypothetical protein